MGGLESVRRKPGVWSKCADSAGLETCPRQLGEQAEGEPDGISAGRQALSTAPVQVLLRVRVGLLVLST